MNLKKRVAGALHRIKNGQPVTRVPAHETDADVVIGDLWEAQQEAQVEIDRLKAENAELKTRFGELLQQEFRGHQLQDRMMFTVKGREIIDWWVALDKSAIAKARSES